MKIKINYGNFNVFSNIRAENAEIRKKMNKQGFVEPADLKEIHNKHIEMVKKWQ